PIAGRRVGPRTGAFVPDAARFRGSHIRPGRDKRDSSHAAATGAREPSHAPVRGAGSVFPADLSVAARRARLSGESVRARSRGLRGGRRLLVTPETVVIREVVDPHDAAIASFGVMQRTAYFAPETLIPAEYIGPLLDGQATTSTRRNFLVVAEVSGRVV